MPHIKVTELNQIYNIIFDNIFIGGSLHARISNYKVISILKKQILNTSNDIGWDDDIYNCLVHNVLILNLLKY